MYCELFGYSVLAA